MSPIRGLAVLGAVVVTAGGLAVAGATAAQAATPTPCKASQLAVTHTLTDGAAGHTGVTLLYRNTAATSCTLRGYPGLDGIKANGKTLVHAARTPTGTPGVRTVTIKANSFASAVAEWSNITSAGNTCPTSSGVRTTAPNTTTAVGLSIHISICHPQIHPVVSGTGGQDAYARAQVYWRQGATAVAANMGLYWHKAAVYLSLAHTQYSGEIKLLNELIALPDTSLTPAQIALAHTNARLLDTFFCAPAADYL